VWGELQRLMTDYFALLNELRRPHLNAESLKKKFLALSAEAHPDKVQTSDPSQKEAAAKRFAELNSAYTTLKEPKDRLRHLLELEMGAKPRDLQQIPPDMADLFMQVGALCKQVDNFLKEKAGVTSPLLQAQQFERGQELADRLMSLQRNINERQEALMKQLQSIDSQWMSNESTRSMLLPQLEEIWRLQSFYSRWSHQLQERLTGIAF
jgi:curved DNA-binding protein CbpA